MSEVRFTDQHEWVRLDGDEATVGITRHAAEQLGDVVFVELPQAGRKVGAGGEAAVVESVKAASEVYAPVGGEVTAHICTGINQVKKLPQTTGSPYYAAFCYQVIRSLDEPFAIFYRAKDAIPDSVYKDMSDDALHQAEQHIYDHAAADPELRRLLLDAYAIKKRFLNFTVEE